MVISGILIPTLVVIIGGLIKLAKNTATLEEKIATHQKDIDILKHEFYRNNEALVNQNQKLREEVIRLQMQVEHYEKRFDALESLLKDLIKAIKGD